MLTPAYVATAITEEKEGKTLEFLLATDLGSREIVLGKLLARVANIVLVILAGLPILGLLELSGGVSPDWVLVAFAATVVSMLSLAAVSTACSVYARKSLTALLCTYLIVVVYLAVSAALQGAVAVPAIGGMHVTGGEDANTLADVVHWFNAGNLPVGLVRLNQSLLPLDRGSTFELLRNSRCFTPSS